jgi:TonB family protein
MLKYVLLASVCLMGAAWAESDTAPVLTGYKECSMRITAEGTVAGAEIVESSGDTKYDQAAVECVSRWTYKPATHDGKPVEHQVVFAFGTHLEGSPEDHKPFNSLKRDIDRRCHKLYPVKPYDLKPGHNISLVTVARLPSGEIQAQVTQSAGERPDKQAVACVKALIADPDHADLPPTFAHTFEVRWEQRN